MAELIRPPVQAVEIANVHNESITAATNILSAALAPSIYVSPVAFRVMVNVGTAGVFSAVITKSASAQTVNFNSGSNLIANALYIFDLLVHSGDTVNFRHSVNATLKVLRVVELPTGAL